MALGQRILAKLRTCDPETRDGSAIRRMFLPSERYVIDFDDELRRAWKQYDTDQDAHYFGTWVNLETREVLTYAEGDWSLETMNDNDAMRACLERMASLYGSPPPAMVAYDANGTRTEVYDPRPSMG
jgi:hypothetical protein